MAVILTFQTVLAASATTSGSSSAFHPQRASHTEVTACCIGSRPAAGTPTISPSSSTPIRMVPGVPGAERRDGLQERPLVFLLALTVLLNRGGGATRADGSCRGPYLWWAIEGHGENQEIP